MFLLISQLAMTTIHRADTVIYIDTSAYPAT